MLFFESRLPAKLMAKHRSSTVALHVSARRGSMAIVRSRAEIGIGEKEIARGPAGKARIMRNAGGDNAVAMKQ